MKWSDGKPFTADDFVFWFEDIYRNKDLVPTPAAVLAINGKQGVIEKVDTYTVRYKFPEPYFMLPDVLAGSTELAGQMWGYRAMGGFAPAHYLKQFLPKYAGQAEVDKKAKDAKFDSWVRLFLNRNDWAVNPDLPVLSPWKTVTPINTPTWTLERNPYSVFVDTAGNQLPYHRQGRADARGKPGSAEPARDRGRVRLRLPARRPRQAARLPREPAEGQLQGPPGSR
jgi:ABC-type dipeptide transport system, periplasmic component